MQIYADICRYMPTIQCIVGKLQVTITKDSIHPCHFLHVVQLIKTKNASESKFDRGGHEGTNVYA